MKIRQNISKYYGGGIVYTPFIPNEPQETITSTSGSTTQGKDNPFTKEVMEILAENGIPNDVDTFLSQANNLLQTSSVIGQSLFTGDAYDMSDVIKLRSLANKIKFNKQLYDDATEQMTKERSWSEAAMNDKGQMYVYSDKGMSLIDPYEYYKNSDQYTILTNSQLLTLRETQPNLSYNQTILNNISNSVGTESIVNYLKGVIKDFGTKSTEGYTNKNQADIESGFANLLMGGPEGYYKITNKDQGTEKALEYLYNTLPSNMLHTLRVKTAAEGGNPNSKQDVMNLIGLALTEHTNHAIELKHEGIGSSGSGSGSSNSANLTDVSRAEAMAYGRIVDGNWMNILPTGVNSKLEVYAQPYGVPTNRLGDQVQQSTLQKLLDNAEVGKIIDKGSMYFGNTKIDWHNIDKIVWDNTQSQKRVVLPYTIANDGSYKPDLDVLEKYEEFSKFVENHPELTNIEKMEKAKTMGLDIHIDQNNKVQFNDSAVMPFMVIAGFAGEKALSDPANDNFIYKTDGDEEDNLETLLERIIQADFDKDYSVGWTEDIYKGNIFMPITDSKLALFQSNNELTPKSSYIDVWNQAQEKERLQNSNFRTTF